MFEGRGARGAAALLAGASALAICAVALPASAQDRPAPADEPASDEVVVTGIRQSLKNAQQIKRTSEVFVDSVTAEDIGALPDRSVTEALQRVPGVSINRFAAGVDPDHFSVEGSGVVVRGLNFVRSELNGRDAFTANNGRGLGFADVPSELVGGVDVFKSPSADLIEGGIAGTVNLRTRVPFDSRGRVLAFTAEASYGDFVEEWAPTFSVLASDRWDTEIGEFGLLVSYVDSELTTRSDGTQVSNYGCRENLGVEAATCPSGAKGVWFPRGAAFRSQTTERERVGYGAAAQWRSNDRTVVATLQFLRSESSTAWTEHAMEIATDNVASNGDSRPVVGTTFGFDSSGVFTNGVITGPTGWRSDQPCCGGRDNRTPPFGLQSNNIRRDVQNDNMVQDVGFNLKWTPNERWSFNLDVQHVESTVENLDAGLWASTYQNLDLRVNGDKPPVFTFLPPSETGTVQSCPGGVPDAGAPDCPRYYQASHASFSDPFNSFWRSAMDHIEDSEGTQDSVRLDADYKFAGDSWLDSIRFGARWAERDQTTRFSTYNWGVLSEQWGEGGPVWLDDPIDGVPNGSGLPTGGGSPTGARAQTFAFDNFFRGDVPVPTGDQPRLFYAQNIAQNYAAYSAFALSVGDEWRARLGANGCPQNWVPLALRCGVVAGTPFLPGEINPVNEVNEAAYVMLRFGGDLADGQRITGNIGVRYTQTDRQTEGFVSFPTSTFPSETTCAAPVPPGQTVQPFCQLPPDTRNAARNWANGANRTADADHSYSHWLPSLNVKWELNPEMLIRFGASKAIALPEIGLTRNFRNYAFGVIQDPPGAGGVVPPPRIQGSATVGNPFLDPIESTNLDLSWEWYFAPVGSLTVTGFYKELDGVLTNTTQRVPVTNNGATFDVVLTTPGNSDQTGKVKGFEIGYQQFYDFLPAPFDKFGINANYTYVDSSGVSQSTLSATDPDVGAGRTTNVDTSKLPLQGLSEHNVNFAAIYENSKISARLAYNWRSEFLLTVRDVIVPFAPIMNEATGQLDGSFFYTINDNLKVGVQGVNLLNEITQTSQVLNDELLTAGRSWFMNDRRVSVVLRGTF
jgi:TonB-dependent receptor